MRFGWEHCGFGDHWYKPTIQFEGEKLPRKMCVFAGKENVPCGYYIRTFFPSIINHIYVYSFCFYFNDLVPQSGGQVLSLLFLVSVAPEIFMYDRFFLISPDPSFDFWVVGMGGICWKIALGN